MTYSPFNGNILKKKKIMAKNISKKKPLTVNLRSKACNATKSRQKPNLQKKTINGKTVLISAREAKKIS